MPSTPRSTRSSNCAARRREAAAARAKTDAELTSSRTQTATSKPGEHVQAWPGSALFARIAGINPGATTSENRLRALLQPLLQASLILRNVPPRVEPRERRDQLSEP